MPLSKSALADRQDAPTPTKWETRLERLTELADGWNGYAAPKPETRAIEATRLYLQALGMCGLEPHRLEASVMGGVGVTHRTDDRKVYIEFYNDGRVHALFSQRPLEMRTQPLHPTLDDYKRFLAEVNDFLHG